ncbi:beta-galactosidase [Candidatus Saccharibacteria bacterium]|nr:beta-galactosidase [Candidatus Saccharibacteria bacterium]
MPMPSNVFGASLSIKQCRNFAISDIEVLLFAIKQLKIKHFRLMSYWDEIETSEGVYNFSWLDAQVRTIAKHHGTITMCLGVRQPRWPESHWPEWTHSLTKQNRNQALCDFITATVNRYRHHISIVSWQLENEALLKNFGEAGDYDRSRLRQEFSLVKQLDPSRPIIMTTSTSWGIPMRKPIPDIIGFSLYRVTFNRGYRTSIYQPWVFKLRSFMINMIWGRSCFIHELQAEPWGPKNIWEMSTKEQSKSMSTDILKANLKVAKDTNLKQIDLWGLEWWYWCKQQKRDEVWQSVKKLIK